MVKLPNTLLAWNSASFAKTLEDELRSLEAASLPLAHASSQGGYIDDGDISYSLLGSGNDAKAIHARVGVFFSESVAACSCGDEPTVQIGYCEIRVGIDKITGEATFAPVSR